jgi:hypothetical protein
MLPIKFRFIWPNGYRREEFFKSANQKQESPMAAMFVNGSERKEADVKNSSPLKPFGQMYRNLVGSIYGKSSVVIAYVVLIR